MYIHTYIFIQYIYLYSETKAKCGLSEVCMDTCFHVESHLSRPMKL